MSIDCRNGNWALPQVMLLVNMLIDPLAMHETMRIIKAKLLDQNANSNFEKHPVESRKLANSRHASKLHRVERKDCEGNANEYLITDDTHDDFNQFLCVDWLVRVRLDFVSS